MPNINPLPEDNPFSLVFAQLWKMARANPKLMAWFDIGNLIEYATNTLPKPEIADADLPELVLISEATLGNIKNTSTTTMLIKNYNWAVVTGDFRMEQVYSQIQWELFRSMVPWCSELAKLEWKGQKFVKRMNVLTSQEGTLFSDENRNILGWSLIWPFEVEMHINTSLITEGLLSTEDC